jgi:hypothetical protein
VAKTPKRPGELVNVTRIEFENLDSAVRSNRLRIEQLETKFESLLRELAELKQIVRALQSR